jgi:hypothetical protein
LGTHDLAAANFEHDPETGGISRRPKAERCEKHENPGRKKPPSKKNAEIRGFLSLDGLLFSDERL